jgi:succinate dehydrogenase / fumarate reductase cytochrome b subunit
LLAAASGPNAYAGFGSFMSSFVGRFILLGYTWALVHHALGGIRHLIWDTGRGLDLPTAQRMAQINLAGSIVITIAIWIAGFLVKG